MKLKVVDSGGCVAVPRSIGGFKPRRVVVEHGFRLDTEAHADPLSPPAWSTFANDGTHRGATGPRESFR